MNLEASAAREPFRGGQCSDAASEARTIRKSAAHRPSTVEAFASLDSDRERVAGTSPEEGGGGGIGLEARE